MQPTNEPVLADVDEARREVALFRYGVIADLTHLELRLPRFSGHPR